MIFHIVKSIIKEVAAEVEPRVVDDNVDVSNEVEVVAEDPKAVVEIKELVVTLPLSQLYFMLRLPVSSKVLLDRLNSSQKLLSNVCWELHSEQVLSVHPLDKYTEFPEQ